jgi:hypothetical protein
MDPRYPLNNPDALLSPSLLIYRALVRRNLETMIALARGADRLRPHVKTHKMAEIVRLSERLGIHKHTCATIAEAEVLAVTGATDVLLAYPMVGPNVARLARLVKTYPEWNGKSPPEIDGSPSDRGGVGLGVRISGLTQVFRPYDGCGSSRFAS